MSDTATYQATEYAFEPEEVESAALQEADTVAAAAVGGLGVALIVGGIATVVAVTTIGVLLVRK